MENKPNIRFKGFTDDWEQRKLSDVAGVYDGVHQTPDYQDEGIMFLSVENIATMTSEKYISEEAYERDYKVRPEKGDILMTRIGDVGTPNVVETDEKLAYYVSLALLKPKGIDSYFFNNAIQSSAFQHGLRERTLLTAIPMKINKDEIGKVDISFPTDVNEQRKIGESFKQLDNLITLHQRQCDDIKQLKKYMLQKMFPRKDQNVPEIRFDCFSDDWEQRKFSDLYAPLVERNSDLLPYNKTLSVATMTYKTDGNGAADSSLANYKRLRTGDIAFEGHTSKSFRYGRFVLNDVGDGIMSPRFSALRPLAQMPTNFWKYYIHYEPIMRKILVASTKAGTMMNELVIDEFLKSSVLVPSIEEQTRIGSILKNIDNLITLHQHKCNQLNELKKYMLSNMFPKKGA